MGFLAIVNCLAKLEKGSQEICFIGILFLPQFPYLDLQFLGTRLLDTPDYPHPEHFNGKLGFSCANIKSPGDLAVAVGAALSAVTSGAVSLAPGAGGGITLAINMCNLAG